MQKPLNVIYEFGPFRFVPEQQLLLSDGKPISLTMKGFEILHVLIQNRGYIVGKNELMSVVWADSIVEESNLTQNVSVLRRALGETRKQPRYIETVQGRGYRFIAPVVEVSDLDGDLIRGQRENVDAEEQAIAIRPNEAINALAILPLVNESDDPEAEYLSDGITESLINALSQLKGLRVMARSTVFRYKGQEVEAQKVGRELNVQMVMAGRVLKLGERLVIRAELVSAVDGTQMWGEQYSRQNSDVFAIQEEIAEEITTKLRVTLTAEERGRLNKRHTDNVEAYHLYLRGCHLWNKYTEEGLMKAIEYFEQAIELEPDYALAYAGLADTFFRLSDSFLPPRDALPKAKRAASAAVEIDDSLAQAHSSLGLVKMSYDHDWAIAGKEFERAVELNPGAALIRQRHGLFLMYTGRFDEALAENRLALELDPLSLQANVSVGVTLYLMGRSSEALDQMQKALELAPDYPPTLLMLGRIHVQMNNFPAAIAEFERARQAVSNSHIPLGFIGRAYAVFGQRGEALSVIEELKETSKRHYISPYSIAIIYIALGMFDEAFEWLEKTYEEHSDWLVWLRVGPELDGIRTDPRFADLLRRVGFPE